jgi:isoleucyl-tRNA synthetase
MVCWDGHALQDIVTRYASQTGCHVVRRFGWDCHGLPVEFEIDKKLGERAACGVLGQLLARQSGAVRPVALQC